jgi:polyisoprenyl-phosphate glycosyltransferase
MSPPRQDFVVVTPVFEDRNVAQRLFVEIAAACGADAYVVAVDDGSVRDPLTAADIAGSGLDGVVLRLRRNLGHQRAIAVGLDYAAKHLPHARRIVVMDSDGEDVPATIPALLRGLDDPQVDVVVAQRKSRVETLRFKAFYLLYKLLYWLLTGRRISFGNYMAMTAPALRRLTAMGELGTHVAATVLISRLRWIACPLDRGPRYAGRGKMTFVGLVLHGFKGLMVFAEDVLVRVGAACLLVAGASLLGALAAIVLKSIGYATPGWFSVALGVLLLMFLQTGAIALMTLLLSGIARNALVLPIAHEQLIDSVLPARERGDG